MNLPAASAAARCAARPYRPSRPAPRTRVARCRADAGDSRPRAQGVVYSNTGVTPTPSFPLTVPFLPFTVEEVLTPGAVKTLHLYEAKYLSLLEEVLSSDHKLFAHVVVELSQRPRGSAAAQFPGAFVGENFVLLMGTIVKVLDVRAVEIGAVVRVQAEARARVTGVTQAAPFIRGRLEPLQDAALAPGEVEEARALMAELLAVMRDVQNLSLKFKARATSQLQQAMYWWEKPPIIAGARQPSLTPDNGGIMAAGNGSSSGSSSSSSSGPASSSTALELSSEAGDSSSSSSSSSSQAGDAPGAPSSSSPCDEEVEGRHLRLPGYRKEVQASSSSDGVLQEGGELAQGGAEGLSGTEEISPGSSLDELTGAGGSSSDEGEGEEAGPLSLALLSERACRLSFAALQHVPGASEKEQLQLVRKRVAAMETSSSLVRLRLALEVMSQTRALLAAKCAIKALNIG